MLFSMRRRVVQLHDGDIFRVIACQLIDMCIHDQGLMVHRGELTLAHSGEVQFPGLSGLIHSHLY